MELGTSLKAVEPGPTLKAPSDWGCVYAMLAGLQPPLVSRVWKLLLHHRDVFESQLQLQILQDRGPSSPK